MVKERATPMISKEYVDPCIIGSSERPKDHPPVEGQTEENGE